MRPRVALGLLLGAGLFLLGPHAQAQVPVYSGAGASPPPAPESGEAGARKHFERALELYRAGRYAEALEALEHAARLDPNGKDLLFNLALVHEKLGQLPEAIASLERFRELEHDQAERERARLSIERLRGAQQAAAVAQSTTAPCPQAVSAPPPPAPVPAPNALLIGAASLTVVSLVVGTVFGLKALADDPRGTPTSASLSATALRQRGERSQTEALVADVAFALAAASAGTFAGVWLLAPGDASKRSAGFTLRGAF